MNRRSSQKGARRRQAGWSLLEAVVGVAVMGLMVTGFWKTLELVERKNRSDEAREMLQRAEDALYGLALRDHRLPMPEDATLSTRHPHLWEGWLPAHVLVTEPERSIRYVVDRSLAAAPRVIHRADPMRLVGDAVSERSDTNGFDLCLNIHQLEQTAFATRTGARLAFGLQQADAQRGGPVETPAAGYLEMVHRLGCVPAWARLATAVKAAALASDLHAIASVNARLRGLAIQDAEDALVNHQWRLANCAVRLAVSSWNLVATKLTGGTTPVGALKVATNVVGFTLEATRWAMLMDYSIEKMNDARADLDAAMAMWAKARELMQDRDDERIWRVNQVNLLQRKGLLP